MRKKLNEKWDGDDAVSRGKFVGRYRVELIGGTQRGACIRLWHPATVEEAISEERLPHIFTITPDKKWFLLDEVNFWRFINAEAEYADLRKSGDILALARRNRFL